MKSGDGADWFTNIAQNHPVLKTVTKEEFQREITDTVLSALLKGHEDVIKCGSIVKDCNGDSCTVVPMLAGIVGDNLEQLRWLHCRKNHCHICKRSKNKLGEPGWLPEDELKHSRLVMCEISMIRDKVIDYETGRIKNGCKTLAEKLCKDAGIYTSALHTDMAPIIRQQHCDAFQMVSSPPHECDGSSMQC